MRFFFFFSSRRRHTRFDCDWSSDVCSSDLVEAILAIEELASPENRPLLDAKVIEARVANPYLDPADSPECRALQLWLLRPYKMIEGQSAAGGEKTTPALTYYELPLSSVQPQSIIPNPNNQLSTPNHQPPCAAILPSVKIDDDSKLSEYFMPHQVAWILGEDEFHAQ